MDAMVVVVMSLGVPDLQHIASSMKIMMLELSA
jgi:hypothetical protein